MPAWGARAATAAYAAVAVGIVGHMVREDWSYAAISLAAVAVIAGVVWWPRRRGILVPVELELLLLWGVVTDNVVGRLMGAYDAFWWYDKALHFTSSLLAAIVFSLVAQALRDGKSARTRRGFEGLVIVLLVLGLGGWWELAEYAADFVFGRGAQTSQQLAPIDDTMWDFIMNSLGSILGVVATFAWLSRHGVGDRRRAFVRFTQEGIAQPPSSASA